VSPGELPEEVRRLIRSSVPSIDALECFLILVRHPERTWTVGDLVTVLRPTAIADQVVAAFLDGLRAHGLVVEREAGHFAYQAASPALATAVQGLLKAYHERPVTLIRTVYAIADSRKIQGFADAFKLKPDHSDDQMTIQVALYLLSVITCLACTVLLFREYLRSKARLLLWSTLCFVGLTGNNVLLVLDLILFPGVDLRLARLAAALGGMLFLLYGFIWEAET